MAIPGARKPALLELRVSGSHAYALGAAAERGGEVLGVARSFTKRALVNAPFFRWFVVAEFAKRHDAPTTDEETQYHR